MTNATTKAIDAANTAPTCDSVSRAEHQLRLEYVDLHFHPLETIAFFRRWPRSFLCDLIYTVIFNLMFAAGFTLMALFGHMTSGRAVTGALLWDVILGNLLIANVIGFAFWTVLEAIQPVLRWINMRTLLAVVLFYSVLGTAIVTASFTLIAFLPGFDNIHRWLLTPAQLVSSFIIAFIISMVIGLIWQRRMKEFAAQIAVAEERERAESAERALTQANLRALQAQIEPHFLFNTLANVTSLIHSRPDDAKRMLEEFIAYLRASLSNTRQEQTTLRQEFTLMQSFLAVLKVRMGTRLQANVMAPPELAEFHLPPMLIQPLVENAIKHGLEPNIDGGKISLSAKQDGDMVHITVADTGLGFQDATSDGIGLKNVRERLDKIYAGRARLEIADNLPRGTKITISIPS